MAEDLRKKLVDNASRRAAIAAESQDAEQEERDLIAQAWRERIPPSEIAQLTQRSPAHIRNLRPADVPPLRMGGGAAPKRRGRAKKKAPPTSQ